MSSVWNNAYWLLLLFVGAVFFFLNLQTPFLHDDYAYCFYYDSNSAIIRPTNTWVTGLWQMVQSMWNHYQYVNGRFCSHLLLQFFCAFLGKGIFNVLNTLVFMVFLHTLVSLSGGEHSISSLSCVFFASLCLLPFPGQTMLWMTGSVNYLWPTTFSLLYLSWLKHNGGKHLSLWGHAMAFLICLVIGWSNESVTIPVAFGLFLFFFFNRTKFCQGAICSYLGYALGALLIAFGPGTASRLSPWEELVSQRSLIQTGFIHLYNLVWGFIHSRLPVIAILVLLYFLIRRRIPVGHILRNDLSWILLGFTLFLLALGWDEPRVYFGFSAFCLLLVLRATHPLLDRLDQRMFPCFLLIVLCCFPVVQALKATRSYYLYDRSVSEEIRSAPEKCIVKKRPYVFKSRYVYVTRPAEDRFDFHNRVKAFYYGKEFIQALPDDLFDAVVSGRLGSSLTPSKWEINGRPFLAYAQYLLLPVDEIPARRLSSVFHYQVDNAGLKVHQRIFRYLLNTQDWASRQSDVCYGIESGGENYLVIPKKDERNLIGIQITDKAK